MEDPDGIKSEVLDVKDFESRIAALEAAAFEKRTYLDEAVKRCSYAGFAVSLAAIILLFSYMTAGGKVPGNNPLFFRFILIIGCISLFLALAAKFLQRNIRKYVLYVASIIGLSILFPLLPVLMGVFIYNEMENIYLFPNTKKNEIGFGLALLLGEGFSIFYAYVLGYFTLMAFRNDLVCFELVCIVLSFIGLTILNIGGIVVFYSQGTDRSARAGVCIKIAKTIFIMFAVLSGLNFIYICAFQASALDLIYLVYLFFAAISIIPISAAGILDRSLNFLFKKWYKLVEQEIIRMKQEIANLKEFKTQPPAGPDSIPRI